MQVKWLDWQAELVWVNKIARDYICIPSGASSTRGSASTRLLTTTTKLNEEHFFASKYYKEGSKGKAVFHKDFTVVQDEAPPKAVKRAWFLKETHIDIPVLKLLSGESIHGLCALAAAGDAGIQAVLHSPIASSVAAQVAAKWPASPQSRHRQTRWSLGREREGMEQGALTAASAAAVGAEVVVMVWSRCGQHTEHKAPHAFRRFSREAAASACWVFSAAVPERWA